MKAKRVLTVLVATVTVLSMLGAPSAAAPRTWSKVLLSQDGRTWSRNLTKPLFPKSVLWVPGDVATSKFYVRNRSGERARLGIVIRVNDSSKMLRTKQLRMSVKFGTSKWVAVTKTRQQLVTVNVPAGAIKRVLVRVRLHAAAGNSSKRKREPFNFRVRLTSLPKR